MSNPKAIKAKALFDRIQTTTRVVELAPINNNRVSRWQREYFDYQSSDGTLIDQDPKESANDA